LLARGWWFSPDTPAFSTTKTGRHEIVEILLKVALNTKNQIKSNLIVIISVKLSTQGLGASENFFYYIIQIYTIKYCQ
jgi:hypothetical protein